MIYGFDVAFGYKLYTIAVNYSVTIIFELSADMINVTSCGIYIKVQIIL